MENSDWALYCTLIKHNAKWKDVILKPKKEKNCDVTLRKRFRLHYIPKQ